VPPLETQVLQVPARQTPEQQSAFIVQGPAFAIQQPPLRQVWPVEQGVPQLPPQPSSPHSLLVQLGVQQPPLRHVSPCWQPTQVPLTQV